MNPFKLAFLIVFSISTAFSQTIFVNGSLPTNGDGTSWATAFNNLDDAIDASNLPTNEIWVAKGTYFPAKDHTGNPNPAENRNKTFFINKNIKLFGGFSGNELNISERIIVDNPSIISGDLGLIGSDSDNCYKNLIINFESIIDGFNIIKGDLGIYIDYSANNTIIRNCNISNNKRGVYNYGDNISIRNCNFLENSPSSGLFNQEGSNHLEILNCLFESNYSESDGGAIYDNTESANISYEKSLIIKNTVFKNNSAYSTGGAIHHYLYKNHINYQVIANPLIVNCVFSNNNAKSGAAISQFITGPVPGEINETILNCTFTGNIYEGIGAVINYFSHWQEEHTLFGVNNIKNSIFTENRAIVSSPGTIFFQNNLMSPANFQYAVNGLGLNYNNCLFTSPLFTNESNPIGLDNKWGTADDGLRLKPCSPAINAGDNSIVPADITTDIAGEARIQLGTVDIGAYESSTNSLPTTAMENTIVTANQSGATLYYSDCDKLVAKVESNGLTPITGIISAKVWIEPNAINYNNLPIVERHYEITPINNATNSTGFITLYFTQTEFDNYNALPNTNIDLPINAFDISGKSALRVIKFPGVSNNASGLPVTYLGSPVTINPDDNNIIWNESESLWEVSFKVTGFSGFIVQGVDLLPLNLIFFSAKLKNQSTELNWQTANELNTQSFDIERSTDGKIFKKIGSVASKNNSEKQNYSFIDQNITLTNSDILYYRLKMIDLDVKFSYSKIVAVSLENDKNIMISPNPTSGKALLNLGNKTELINTMATLTNSSGIAVKQLKINKLIEEIDMSALPKSVYLVRFEDGTTLKIIKE